MSDLLENEKWLFLKNLKKKRIYKFIKVNIQRNLFVSKMIGHKLGEFAYKKNRSSNS